MATSASAVPIPIPLPSLKRAESEAFEHQFSYLHRSLDVDDLLPTAISKSVITRTQSERVVGGAVDKAANFLQILGRRISGDEACFYNFLEALRETGHAEIAIRLKGSG